MSAYINPNEKRCENCALSTRTESNCSKIIKKKSTTKKEKKKKNRLKNKKATYYIDITVCQYTPQYASSYCGDFTHHFRILVISINHYFTFSVWAQLFRDSDFSFFHTVWFVHSIIAEMKHPSCLKKKRRRRRKRKKDSGNHEKLI